MKNKGGSGRWLLLGINLGHWEASLLFFYVLHSYFRFRQVQTNYK